MNFETDFFGPSNHSAPYLMSGRTMAESGQNKPERPLKGKQWLPAFKAFVQDHLDDDHMSVPFIASHFSMSESSLLRKVKSLTGMTPVQHLKAARLTRTKELLDESEINTVNELVQKIGYRDPRSFARIFRERYGKLPSEYLQDGRDTD